MAVQLGVRSVERLRMSLREVGGSGAGGCFLRLVPLTWSCGIGGVEWSERRLVHPACTLVTGTRAVLNFEVILQQCLKKADLVPCDLRLVENVLQCRVVSLHSEFTATSVVVFLSNAQ